MKKIIKIILKICIGFIFLVYFSNCKIYANSLNDYITIDPYVELTQDSTNENIYRGKIEGNIDTIEIKAKNGEQLEIIQNPTLQIGTNRIEIKIRETNYILYIRKIDIETTDKDEVIPNVLDTEESIEYQNNHENVEQKTSESEKDAIAFVQDDVEKDDYISEITKEENGEQKEKTNKKINISYIILIVVSLIIIVLLFRDKKKTKRKSKHSR